MVNNKVEECVKWYWKGWCDFKSLYPHVCPYEIDTQANKHWWLGYADAKRKEK